MKKINGIILTAFYIASMILALPMILFTKHLNSFWFITISAAFLCVVICTVISIIEIRKSKNMKTIEKILWIIVIVCIFTIGELLYIIEGRKNL